MLDRTRVPAHSDITSFPDLFRAVQECSACDRMAGCRRVLSSANGSRRGRIMFIGEAPGRLGAERYGIPLFGDRTGKTFELLLAAAGLTRDCVFITNAVLCNPRTVNNLNDSPTTREIQNCSLWLRRTVEILSPTVVITLGAIALWAASLIEAHRLLISKNVGQPVPWFGRVLVPLYHPGPRALIHRPLAAQLRDYRRLKRYLSRRGLVPEPHFAPSR